MTEMEEFLRHIQGYKYAEVRFHKVLSNSISMHNGRVVDRNTERKEGYAFRGLKGEGLYFASSPTLGSLREMVSYDIPMQRGWTKSLVKGPSVKGTYRVNQQKPLTSLGLEEKMRFFSDIHKNILSNRDVVAFRTEYMELIEKKDFVNTEGGSFTSEVPRVWVMFYLLLKDGSQTISTLNDDLGGAGGFELLEKWRPEEYIGGIYRTLSEVLRKGKPSPKGKMDVVVGQKIAGIIAHESGGHPFEADRVLGRESAQAGRSYLDPSFLGKRIGSDAVNLSDDPAVEGSFGFYTIDDEGVPARKKRLLVKGVVNELMHNRVTSVMLNNEDNGSARAMDYESEPLIRMSNTFFEPGNATFEELLEDVKEGVFIKSFTEWNIDDIRWGQRYVGLEAYEIRDGEIGLPVKAPVLESTTGQIYSSIDLVDRDLKFFSGLCGKGEPMQGVPVWMGGPNMRIRNVEVKTLGS